MMKAVKTWVLIFLLLILAINVYAWPIPDTGQTKCYDNSNAEIPCPLPGEPFYGQDGNYLINQPSYTKLGSAGEALPDDATSWAMVRANMTGLIWENKTSDGTIHDGGKTFTWCDTNPATNGGNQGTCGTGTGDAVTDTEAFIKALNDENFGGFSDWRMPSPHALKTIAEPGRNNPAINTTWFPNAVSLCYWTSTTYAGNSDNAWCILGDNGGAYYDSTKSYFHPARAVRGGESGSLGVLVINGDGTVTDTATSLIWQQGYAGEMTWEAALSYAESLNLAGYDDWRLPNITELQSIVDYNRYLPCINSTVFPNTAQYSYYWSSTTSANIKTIGAALGVSFYIYGFGNVGKSVDNAEAVRAVRGGKYRFQLVSMAGDNGTISPSVTVNRGLNSMFTITPYKEYNIADILVDGISVEPVKTYSFQNVEDDHTIVATFILIGDLNMSGSIDLADAIIALRSISNSKQIGNAHKGADVDGDRKIGMAEAIYVLQCIARLRNNHAPELSPIANKSTDEGSALIFTLSATDEDNDPLSFSATPLPSGATLDAMTGTFSWTPTYSQSGTYQLTFTVDDEYGGRDSETISITVMDKVPVFTTSEYFPMNVGDWWDYYLNTTDNVVRKSVTGTRIIGSRTTKQILRAGGIYVDFYTSEQDGLYLYGSRNTSSALDIIFKPPILLLPNTVQIGTSQISTSTYTFVYSGYTYHVNVTSTVSVLGIEDVQTENKILRDCVKISKKTDQKIVETGESLTGDTEYMWMYKGVGWVKRTQAGEGSDVYTITKSNVNGVIENY
jgi:hypothetical protein